MPAFELGGALAPAIPDLVVGPWSAAPGIVAFDAATGPPESLWRVDLARDLTVSRAALADGERSVARVHAVLDDAPRRFDRALAYALADRASARPHLARTSPASTVGDHRRAAPALSPVESRLITALTGADHHGPSQEPSLAWAVDAPGESGSARESGRAAGWLERTLDQIADLARGRARTETRVEGALVACSIMTLSGDTDLWFAPGLSLAGATLHARAVAAATRTRHAWVRILTMVVGNGSRLLALGLPAAGLTALPLVWRFVRDLLRDARDRAPASRPAA
jgi:hypothetical protein